MGWLFAPDKWLQARRLSVAGDGSQNGLGCFGTLGVLVPSQIMKISICLEGCKEQQLLLFQQAKACNIEMGFLAVELEFYF